MTERRIRKDAARNRAAILAAADALFARRDSATSAEDISAEDISAEDISMADIAAAAGVGKGTLFRAFGDRTGLIRALYQARLDPIADAIETGPAPLGPGTPPLHRVPALLDAVLSFKLENRRLALALESSGTAGSTSPYEADHYARWHALLRDLLEQVPGRVGDSSFAAHALLAATRADLVEYLVGREHVPHEMLRAQLAGFTAAVLGAGPATPHG